MKRTHVYTVLLAIGVALLAGAQSKGPRGPQGELTWTSYVADTRYYAPELPGWGGSEVVSTFNPPRSTTITRIELQSAYGPVRTVAAPPSNVPCNNNPALILTDGSTSYSLPLPTPPSLGGGIFASSADSGPVDLSFPPGANITIRVAQGDMGTPPYNIGQCLAQSVNVTVQYKSP